MMSVAGKPAVCVFLASSPGVNPVWGQIARDTGRILAELGHPVVYGGGARGRMGELATGVIEADGTITGVIPRFMVEREWAHGSLGELVVVEDMADRKQCMFELSQISLTLPGGLGTLDEMFESLCLSLLEQIPHPNLLMNAHGYFDPILMQLERAQQEGLYHGNASSLPQVLAGPQELASALKTISGRIR